jgi:hypothetical protein
MVAPSCVARVVSAAASVAALITSTLAQNACPFVPSNFRCTYENSHAFSSQCDCFSCGEVDSIGSYQCNSTTVCSGSYKPLSTQPTATTSLFRAYISIGIVFLAVSLLVYGALRVLARFMRVIKDDIDKDADDRPEKSRSMRAYVYIYEWAFGALYKSDGIQRRSFCECWIAGCELLDCFWCCTQRSGGEDDWRPFYMRAMRLLASLSVGASLGMMFGSLEFGSLPCETRSSVSYCSSGGSNTQSAVVSTVCEEGPAILDLASLTSAASIVAFISTQCVKFVGSYAQSVGKCKTKLDLISHVLWLLVALAAFPVCYAVSSQLLSPSAYDHKDTALRVRLVVSITLSTWIKDQAADLAKGPFVYAIKNSLSKCLPNPNSQAKKQTVEPMPLELVAPNKYHDAAAGDHSDSDNEKPMPQFFAIDDDGKERKIDTITSPRPTTLG